MGLTNSREYIEKYKIDPLLPYSPQLIYYKEWIDWAAFLNGKPRKTKKIVPAGIYPSYSQAKLAVRFLGFKTKAEYQAGYKKDKRLPQKPEDIYSQVWKSWDDFLRPVPRISRRESIYPTLKKAKRAAKKLGALSARDYIKLHKQDTGLPSNPSTYYPDWIDWHDYLGTTKQKDRYYKTLKRASSAARALKVTSAREYIKAYKRDSKLHSNPSQFYQDWVSWDNFLKGK